MIINSFKNIKLESVSCAVPTEWKSIASLKDGSNDDVMDRFVKNTMIQGHYAVCEKQTSADLCYAAANAIIEKKKIAKEQISVLVYVTQTPDYRCPSTACILQDRLDIPKDSLAFDVNLGCSGYAYGLNIAASLLATSNAQMALVLVGDASTKHNVRTDNSRLLFGDSGTATLLVKDESTDEMAFACKTDGSGFKYMLQPYGQSKHHVMREEGCHDEIATFNFAINEAPALINEFLKSRKESADDYDYIVLHQANMMIMKQIAKRTGFPKDKMIISIDKFANTSNGSIPTTIVHKLAEGERKDLKLLVCGYGIGLSWSVGSFTINSGDILPLVHSDEFFDDGLFDE